MHKTEKRNRNTKMYTIIIIIIIIIIPPSRRIKVNVAKSFFLFKHYYLYGFPSRIQSNRDPSHSVC
jgi:hypothetical protein